MTAGTGVMHSEFNASKEAAVHFLQIWLLPAQRGLKPGYEQKTFTAADKRGKLALVASPDGRDGSVTLHADARVYAGLLAAGETAQVALTGGRGAWVHVARGNVRVGGELLGEGDGAAIEGASAVELAGVDDGEVLVFDLAAN
jgi:redox-sensitive bicupin YhaK (pirin superfamily)